MDLAYEKKLYYGYVEGEDDDFDSELGYWLEEAIADGSRLGDAYFEEELERYEAQSDDMTYRILAITAALDDFETSELDLDETAMRKAKAEGDITLYLLPKAYERYKALVRQLASFRSQQVAAKNYAQAIRMTLDEILAEEKH